MFDYIKNIKLIFNIINNKKIFNVNLFTIFFILIFYIFIIYEQKKRINNYKKFINSLKIGDEIITKSGFLGKVYKIIDSNYVIISLNKYNKFLIRKDFILSYNNSDAYKKFILWYK